MQQWHIAGVQAQAPPFPGNFAGQPLGSGTLAQPLGSGSLAQPLGSGTVGGQAYTGVPMSPGAARQRLSTADMGTPVGTGTLTGAQMGESPSSRARSMTWAGTSPWHSPVVSPSSSMQPPPGYTPQNQHAGYPASGPGRGMMHLQTGSHTLKGMKPNMPDWINQDVSVVVPLEGNRLLAAVFDGHGKHGHICSRMAGQVVINLAKQKFGLQGDLSQGFHGLFRSIHSALVDQGPEVSGLSGCTGTIGVVDPTSGACHIGHVGDSTAIVASNHGLVFSTQDHRIEPHDEQRINARGGEVRRCEQSGAVRVFARGMQTPGLALGRSLGDLEANSVGVLAEPELKLQLPFDVGSALVIASDGLWDVLPKDGVGAKARTSEPKECATTMVTDARAQWARFPHIDDITCVIIRAVPPPNAMPQGTMTSPRTSTGVWQQGPASPAAMGPASPARVQSFGSMRVVQ
mmetsp:Transcript_66535/g.124120  ORF Transcript_66535/g.124120 Transcript_66535/m.124120 type:complete len:459 (+) Transcript_66535:84-1460(+)